MFEDEQNVFMGSVYISNDGGVQRFLYTYVQCQSMPEQVPLATRIEIVSVLRRICVLGTPAKFLLPCTFDVSAATGNT